MSEFVIYSKRRANSNSKCNIRREKFVSSRAPRAISYTYFRERKTSLKSGNKANPPRLSVIFSGKVVPYSQTSDLEYNTVRNEIRRIDNFGKKEIRRREKNIN